MIRRIFLDLDDVCNTLAPFVLHSVGCDIGPSDYARYPREHGFNISDAANAMLGEPRYTPATFWASMPRCSLGQSSGIPLLSSGSWKRVPRRSAARTSALPPARRNARRAWPASWSGFTTTFPQWMHRQYAITPRKHLFARPDSLLIDDYSENIERFEAHGGHAILVPRPWNDNWASTLTIFGRKTPAGVEIRPLCRFTR